MYHLRNLNSLRTWSIWKLFLWKRFSVVRWSHLGNANRSTSFKIKNVTEFILIFKMYDGMVSVFLFVNIIQGLHAVYFVLYTRISLVFVILLVYFGIWPAQGRKHGNLCIHNLMTFHLTFWICPLPSRFTESIHWGVCRVYLEIPTKLGKLSLRRSPKLDTSLHIKNCKDV